MIYLAWFEHKILVCGWGGGGGGWGGFRGLPKVSVFYPRVSAAEDPKQYGRKARRETCCNTRFDKASCPWISSFDFLGLQDILERI